MPKEKKGSQKLNAPLESHLLENFRTKHIDFELPHNSLVFVLPCRVHFKSKKLNNHIIDIGPIGRTFLDSEL